MSASPLLDDAPAGRALDKRVACEVMGWEFFPLYYFATEEETSRMRELEDWMDEVELHGVGDYFIDVAANFWVMVEDFQPSTSIADAWLVVERMNALGYSSSIDNRRNHWRAEFRNLAPNGRLVSVLASTPAHAICLAALRTLAASPQEERTP